MSSGSTSRLGRSHPLTWRFPCGKPDIDEEPKTAKNRVHLDVRVGAENVAAQADRLIARGATFLHKGSQGPHEWVTLADPEGNEFCLD
jgi:hypothetical protein